MRQRGCTLAVALQRRRAETQEAVIGVFGGRSQGAAKSRVTLEQVVGVGGQVAGKGRHLRVAVKRLAAGDLAGKRRAEDRGQPLAAARHHRLASGAHRGERHNVNAGARALGFRHGLSDGTSQHRLEPVVA